MPARSMEPAASRRTLPAWYARRRTPGYIIVNYNVVRKQTTLLALGKDGARGAIETATATTATTTTIATTPSTTAAATTTTARSAVGARSRERWELAINACSSKKHRM